MDVAALRAHLDEDEAIARTAAQVAGPDWAWHTGVTLDDETTDYVTSADGTVLMDTLGGIESDAPHAARHDPARVLREVAFKRQILTLYKEFAAEASRQGEAFSRGGHAPGGGVVTGAEVLGALVKALSTIYSPVPPDAVDRT